MSAVHRSASHLDWAPCWSSHWVAARLASEQEILSSDQPVPAYAAPAPAKARSGPQRAGPFQRIFKRLFRTIPLRISSGPDSRTRPGVAAPATPQGYLDSPACFAALLGTQDNGRWLLAPAGPVERTSRRYVDGTALLARDPYVAFARISALFEPPPERASGMHPSACVDPGAQVAADAAPVLELPVRQQGQVFDVIEVAV